MSSHADNHVSRAFTWKPAVRSVALAGLLLALGCSEEELAVELGFGDFDQAAAITRDFAQVVIAPTYVLLHARIQALDLAVAALAAQPTDAGLATAREAWRAAREPWEQSEGFLFGPVDAFGFDPALDSWPVNRTDLDQVLGSEHGLTAEFVSSLDPALKGFHTAEYMLFGVDGGQTVATLDARELQYLSAVVSEMSLRSGELAQSWTDGFEGAPPYTGVFATAGDPDNSVYPSKQAAAQEIVYGMIGILDEVANGKIADPFNSQDTKLVESQFSFNSLTDFSDNVLSVQNAYLCQQAGSDQSGVAFAAFVADHDPELDQSIRDGLTAALTALAAIPEPFRDAILDGSAAPAIVAAQQAIRGVQTTMEEDVLPLVTR